MHIVEFTRGTLRFLDQLPEHAPDAGFIWIYLEREDLAAQAPTLQRAAQRLGGSPILDVHMADLENAAHPSGYDYTSVYDLFVFRRLATDAEVRAETSSASLPQGELKTFAAVRSRAAHAGGPVGRPARRHAGMAGHAARATRARRAADRARQSACARARRHRAHPARAASCAAHGSRRGDGHPDPLLGAVAPHQRNHARAHGPHGRVPAAELHHR